MSLQGDIVVNIVETGEPAVEPVPLALAFMAASIDEDIAADPTAQQLMGQFITQARDYCENALSRAFVSRTFELRMNRFPFAIPTVYYPYYSLERMPTQLYGQIYIPYPPLVSIEAITYTAPDGTVLTLDPSQYVYEAGGKFQGIVTPAYGVTFPQTRYAMSTAVVAFTAGYSADASKVPAGIKSGMLLLTSHYWRNREATAPGAALPQEIALGVDSCLAPYQWGFYG